MAETNERGAAGLSARRVLDMASGYEPALILEAAVRLGVFDLLSPAPLTLADVVRQTGASERGLRALLNALVGLELLARAGDRYLLTDESRAYLVSTSPDYQGYMCKHVSGHLLPRWLHLTEVVRTGRPAKGVNAETDGAPYFREFVEDIFPMSYDAAKALARELGVASTARPFSALDLAAGSGVWGIAIAEASPRARVTAVDWPDVLTVTRRSATKHRVIDQFHFVEGDLHVADFGRGHDVATLGHILHSEGEALSRRLLKKTFDALKPGGTIAVAEFIADEGREGPPSSLIFAVTMLVNTDAGDTFTFAEMAEWLDAAGFEGAREFDAPGPGPIILARRPV